MGRATRFSPPILGGLLLSACNAMLGISAPYDDVLVPVDGGNLLDATTGSLDGVQNDGGVPVVRDGGASSFDAALTPYDYAWWPMPSAKADGLPFPQDYDTSEEGLVTDRVTGLTWQRVVDASALDAAEAARYCEELDLAGGGFRLPTRIELASLLDVRNENPAIDSTAFPETLGEKHWTSSPYADGPSFTWVVHFGHAPSHVLVEPVGELHPVRCVRTSDAEPLTGKPSLRVTDELVSDELAGLEWQRVLDNRSMTLPEAIDACAALDLGGKAFRLPTLREFQTIVNRARTSPSIDADAFPDTPATLFWTQSLVARFPEYLWTVSFTDGADMWLTSPSAARVRCVRSDL
jgi:Protein of unknown function (DUF1566)